eukprot:gnl/TRDRNA2_/TRDRNA2_92181_c0_seq1.p1 gnl/TRDRNA2_/TRDRNA2_92181_c0~~gnl/TRDRNA2_/TRDRNA2_92181_c0_seq1.p1  ORF type:complete len:608 (+),score=94.60 gnl/TRDRNA2_/TRDRNA2_92181_c0_seq1:115-1824(+)
MDAMVLQERARNSFVERFTAARAAAEAAAGLDLLQTKGRPSSAPAARAPGQSGGHAAVDLSGWTRQSSTEAGERAGLWLSRLLVVGFLGTLHAKLQERAPLTTDSIIKFVRIWRVLKRWARSYKAVKEIKKRKVHIPPCMVRAARNWKRRCAARRLQRCWRLFTWRINWLAKEWASTSWQRHEGFLLGRLFTACPGDGEVAIGGEEFLCDQNDVEQVASAPQQFASHRQKGGGAKLAKAVQRAMTTTVRPNLRRTRQNEQGATELQEIMDQLFRSRHTKQVKSHRLVQTLIRKVLRREIVERMYDHSALNQEDKNSHSFQGTMTKALSWASLGNRGKRSMVVGLPAAIDFIQPEIANLVKLTHYNFGVRPVRPEVCQEFYNLTDEKWFADAEAIAAKLAGRRTIRVTLLEKWEERFRTKSEFQKAKHDDNDDVARRRNARRRRDSEDMCLAGTEDFCRKILSHDHHGDDDDDDTPDPFRACGALDDDDGDEDEFFDHRIVHETREEEREVRRYLPTLEALGCPDVANVDNFEPSWIIDKPPSPSNARHRKSVSKVTPVMAATSRTPHDV